jgi:tetratricopeptide (TPR) repeat protein
VEIYLGLVAALMQAEGYQSDHLRPAIASAQQAAREGASPSLQLRIALESGPLFWGIRQNAEYLATLEEFGHSSSIDRDPAVRAALLVARGIAHSNRGEYVEADRHLRAALELEPLLSPRIRIGGGAVSIVMHHYAFVVARTLGRVEEALQVRHTAERIRTSLDDPFSIAWALLLRGFGEALSGDYESALATADETIAICRKYGFRARMGNGLTLRGRMRALRGELELGIRDYREGLELWRGSGVVFHTPELITVFAGLLLRGGRQDEARAVLDDVDRLGDGTDEASVRAECQRIRGRMATADGDLVSAERWIEIAISTARHQSARLFELRATSDLAELLSKQGRQAEDTRRLGQIYRSFTQGQHAPELRATKAVLDRLSG